MGMYSVHFYGVSISEVFEDLPDGIQDAITEQRHKGGGWGKKFYDGGGYGAIAFIGVEVPRGPKGIAVTEEVEAAARQAYAACPGEVRDAVCKALGLDELPGPVFVSEEGWG